MNSQSEVNFRKTSWVGGWVAAMAFGLYYGTHSPTVLSCADSPELMTAAYTLGVAHPPGYPLYTLLGKFFADCLGGPAAGRFGLFTAFFAALFIFNTYWITVRLTGQRVAGVWAALTLAFSYHCWLFALIPEVTSLETFLVSALLAILVKYEREIDENRRQKLPLLFCFVFGLSLAHHYNVILLIPSFLFFFRHGMRKGFNGARFGHVTMAGALFAAGALLYLYIPIRAAHQPALNSGAVFSFPRFVDHLLRRRYWALDASSYGYTPSVQTFGQVLRFFGSSLMVSFTLPGITLGCCGIYYLFRRQREIFFLLGSAFILSGPVFFLALRLPGDSVVLKALMEKFLGTSFFIFAVAMGVGVSALIRAVPRTPKALPHARPIPLKLLWAIVSLLPAWLLIRNFPLLNFSSYRLCQTYGEDLFRCLEPASIVLVNGDKNIFILWYLQQVEGRRRDLMIVDAGEIDETYIDQLHSHFPKLAMPQALGGDAFIQGLIDDNMSEHKIYTVGIPGNRFERLGLTKGRWRLQPRGLVMQVLPAPSPFEDDKAVWTALALQEPDRSPRASNAFVQETLYSYALAHYNRSVLLLEQQRPAAALEELQQACHWSPWFQEAEQLRARLLEQAPLVR